MTSYKIIVEDMMCVNCAKKIRKALEENGAAVTVNLARKEVFIDSDLPVAEIYDIIESVGFTPTDLEIQ